MIRPQQNRVIGSAAAGATAAERWLQPAQSPSISTAASPPAAASKITSRSQRGTTCLSGRGPWTVLVGCRRQHKCGPETLALWRLHARLHVQQTHLGAVWHLQAGGQTAS